MYRILVADDEPNERMIVEKIIKKYFEDQLEIVLGVNGREAVELFQEKQCHLALLDIEMPGINGLEAAENLRMHAVAENIRKFIETHYMEDIALQDVAVAMNYSDAYFCKLFKQCFDKSFESYLTWFRMEKAKEMLGDVLVNVKDVSVNVGYRDSNYFTKVFKRLVGVTPSEYRLQVLQNVENQ